MDAPKVRCCFSTKGSILLASSISVTAFVGLKAKKLESFKLHVWRDDVAHFAIGCAY